MKKYLSMAAALTVVLALTGCGAKNAVFDAADGGSATTAAGSPSVDAPTASRAEYKSKDIGGVGARPSGVEGDTYGGAAVKDIGGVGVREDKAYDDGAAVDEALDAEFAAAADFAEAVPSEAVHGINDMIVDDDYPIIDEPQITPQAGLLTGGEWNDNSHWADWQELFSKRDDWEEYRGVWKDKTNYRLAVTVTKDGKPFQGAKVSCKGGQSAITDNHGMAYLFFDDMVTFDLTVESGGKIVGAMNIDWVDPKTDLTFHYDIKENVSSPISKKLDLMIMCDTTGSMGDELEYLKEELSDVVTRIKSENANIPVRTSVNFYRDTEDEYEVREFPFSENLDDVVNAIGEQSADGGGDFPEAVHTALKSAVDNDWDEDSVKVMFLVLDAPPHEDAQIIDQVNKLVSQFAEKGIRIVPVASSGIDKSTEYLLRSMAFRTGGTYTFLTDDSGIGGGHIEATVGAYNVEKLNDMMVRIVNDYLEDDETTVTDEQGIVEDSGLTQQSSEENSTEQSSTEESSYDPDNENGGPMVNGHADVTHILMGQDFAISLNSPQAGELLKWLDTLKLTEVDELPDVDGGEAFDITFSEGFTEPEHQIYIIHSSTEHYLRKGEQLYSVNNPSEPPIDTSTETLIEYPALDN